VLQLKLPSCFKLIFLLNLGVYGVLSTNFVLPSLLVKLQFPMWQVGLLMSVFYFGATLARPLGGCLSEKFGARRTIFLSAAAGAVLSLCFAVLDFKVLLVSRFLVGAAYSVIYVALTAYQGRVIPPESRGQVFSYLCLASISPQFVVVPLSELCIDNGAVKTYMLFSAVILAVLALYAVHAPFEAPASAEKGSEKWGTWGEVLSRRDTWALLMSVFVLSFTGTACVQYIPNLARSFGLKATLFTWTFTIVVIFIRLFVSGRLLSVWDRRAAVCCWCFVETLSMLLAAVSSGVMGFFTSGILFGISHGLDFPAISALVPDVIPPRLLPKGSVLYLLANDLPPILLPLILGAVPESVGMSGVLLFSGIAALLLWPFIYWVMWRHPRLHGHCSSGAD
jgi:MFS family permease